MTPIDKLASTALSSKFQAFTVSMTAVMTISDIPGPWRAGAIVLIAAAYMFSRAWEDRGRSTPPTETENG